jgi:bifunctional DNA-binding transcriptional regulator/antitoxin component of YhaV-PrlF toxin-antitoxin module
MKKTQCSRLLDSLGRIVVPKKLRDTYGIETGQEFEFLLHEQNGKRYLCLELPEPQSEEIQKAKAMLERAGYTVSDVEGA